MDTKHTEGLWTLRANAMREKGVDIMCGVLRIATVRDINHASQEEANASLIAAAPELLSAARKFLAFYNDLAKSNPGFIGNLTLQDYAQWNEAAIELPRAIAKAEGR